jgi:hypothetical protein
MRTKTLKITVASAAFAGLMAVASPAMAVVTFDAATGTGFVGKGDVQTVFNWTNKALQTHASTVDFRVNSTSETTWTCTKLVEQGNDVIREIVQQRSGTSTTQGLVTTVARENSKGKDGAVTGFYLKGYEGDAVSVTDGDALGSCPASPSGYVFDDNLQTTTTGGGLEVTSDGSAWYPIG